LATRYPGKQSTDWLAAIRQAGQLYLPVAQAPVTEDPDDEMFIECAVAAQAEYLVTGDKAHLLEVKQVSGTSIVSVSNFLAELGVPENPT
jgi:predicted nucleic acid-binding protein